MRTSSSTDDLIPGPALDSHVHIAVAAGTRFPQRPTGLGRPWWSEPSRDAEALLSTMTGAGVGRAIVVQAVGAYGYDNRYLLSAVAAHRDRLGAVPAVDLDDRTAAGGDPAAPIRKLAGSPGAVGVRLFGVGPGSSWAQDEAIAQVALGAARDAGLVAVLTIWPGSLRTLSRLLRDSPDVAVALDHCAFPDLSGGRVAADAPLLTLRDAANVTLKVSSHLLHEAAAAGGDPADLVAQLAEAFGTERLMWGSDYPQTGGDYGALLGTAAAAAAGLTVEARLAVFGANATRVFFPNESEAACP
jgi:L-fuconolactonase